LWDYFIELNQRREYIKDEAVPFSFAHIYYWSKLTNTKLRLWQIKALLKADIAYLAGSRVK
jgi:hypothetical protein